MYRTKVSKNNVSMNPLLKNPLSLSKLRYSALIASTILCSQAFAQTDVGEASADNSASSASASVSPDDMGSLGEIVVTARRRQESAHDVPMSIVSADATRLNERSVRSAMDLPVVAPGLSASNQGGRGGIPLYAIRGQFQAFGGTGPGVVVYFADVPDFANQIYDLSSVSVLKGPQGTLFGRNTTGGAVQFVPKKPTEEFNGYVNLRAGNYSRRDAEWGIGGGLADGKILMRFSGQYLKRDGYTKNLYDGSRLDDEDKLSLRGSLVLKPTEWLENYTIVQWSKLDENGTGNQIAGFNGQAAVTSPINPSLASAFPGTLPLLSQVQAALDAQRARGPRTIDIDGPHSTNHMDLGVINTTTAMVNDNITLKNIYSWRKWSYESGYDYDGTSLPIAHDAGPINPSFRQETEEFQIQGDWDFIQAIVGYYHESTDKPKHTFFQFGQYNPYPSPSAASNIFGPIFLPQGAYTALSLDWFEKRSSEAFFGQATVKPLDGLAVTAGIRRTKDVREAGSETGLVLPGYGLPDDILRVGPTSGVKEGKATTWNFDILYEVNRSLNVYAKVARGYRAGGINNTASGTGGIEFLPEFVTDYEAGFKYSGRLGGVRVLANVDVFYDKYTNIQRTVTNPGAALSTRTDNAAAGKVWGTDIDVTIVPDPMYSLQVTYSFLHAKYDDYSDLLYGDISNGMFPGAPKHQLVIAPRVVPMSNDKGEVILQGTAFYQSKTSYDVFNTPNGNPVTALGVPGSVVPGYWKVDLRADWNNIMSSDFGAALFVRNVFDKTYVTSTTNLQPVGPSYIIGYIYGEPRMYGIELRYSF